MDIPQSDFERVLYFEQIRKVAETAYAKNPLDAENLTRWGGSLIELSQFQTGADCVAMIKDAITKLEEALEINPRKSDTLWCLGNAHTNNAFYTTDHSEAKTYFARATQCFRKAVEEDPGNELYIRALEMSSKAPELHLEIQKQMAQQGPIGGPSASGIRGSKKKKNSDLKYDVLGWVILAVAVVAWVGLTKSHVPPPQSR